VNRNIGPCLGVKIGLKVQTFKVNRCSSEYVRSTFFTDSYRSRRDLQNDRLLKIEWFRHKKLLSKTFEKNRKNRINNFFSKFTVNSIFFQSSKKCAAFVFKLRPVERNIELPKIPTLSTLTEWIPFDFFLYPIFMSFLGVLESRAKNISL
jgi:hypothetical protein